MNKAQQKRFDSLYQKHLSALRRQGKAEATIDAYSRAIRRVCEYFDCPPDVLTDEQLEAYFESLISTHSWSTVQWYSVLLQTQTQTRVELAGDH